MDNPPMRSALAACVLSLGAMVPSQAQVPDNRLLNLSTRAEAGVDDHVMIAGFVIGEGNPKRVLIRAIGPGLGGLGVETFLADPVLTLYDGDGRILLENDDWENDAAETFTATGAFGLNVGSPDAAIVTTLNPGSYTAIARGKAGATGIVLIEVYDITGATRLINISTRADVKSGESVLISGLVVAPGSGPRRVLVRAAGPALTGLKVEGVLNDPAMAIVRQSDKVQVATNNDWSNQAQVETLTAAMAEAGAFAFDPGSRDAALLIDLAPGAYTVLVTGVGGGEGVSLVEAYDLTPEFVSTVNVAATVPSTETSANAIPGQITFTRSGELSSSLTAYYTLSGSAVGGTDFVNLPGSVTFAIGEDTTTLEVVPYGNFQSDIFTRTATLTLSPSIAYVSGTTTTASVTIFIRAGSLYISNLRPAPGVTSSTAFGTASLQLASDESSAVINFNFSNLSSPQTLAYVRLGQPGDVGGYLFSLPLGQVTNAQWDIRDIGAHTAAEIVQAIKEGRVFISIDTANFPEGELTGTFARSSGSQTFTAPPQAPLASDALTSDVEAARFLAQATFGATPATIATARQLGVRGWIAAQMAKPRSDLRDATLVEFAANPAGGRNNDTRPGTAHRMSAWWKIVRDGDDQLRQRVSFALSELFVVSIENTKLNQWQEGVSNYADILSTRAFGNYRTLLEEVTLSPIMGLYLSHLRNAKADPELGTLPDENYAREIMQLFSIGLNQLQPDGTLKLDADGLPIKTYNNTTIQEMARVFTGWSYYHSNPNNANNFTRGTADYIRPMSLFPAFHDNAAKTIVNGVQLPAGQGGQADLNQALDALFNHPNTGPFVARRLIQRLVTSNPSPAYIYRVAQVFADNGTGVRGDLGAVVTAILTDYEARSPEIVANAGFGKAKEPLLRLSQLLRIFSVDSTDGRIDPPALANDFGQEPLASPTVFNFFDPDYVHPGELAAAGLVAPEIQILTATTAITVSNVFYKHIFNTPSGNFLNYSQIIPLANDADALIAFLNLYLAEGRMSALTLARLHAAYNSLPGSPTDLNNIKSMVYLAIMAPEAAILR